MKSDTNKRGYNVGFFEKHEWESSDEYKAMFGKQVVSKDVNAVTLTFPSDFNKHGFIVGGTGSGKSSMLRSIFKHLEMSNIYASYPQDIPEIFCVRCLIGRKSKRSHPRCAEHAK